MVLCLDAIDPYYIEHLIWDERCKWPNTTQALASKVTRAVRELTLFWSEFAQEHGIDYIASDGAAVAQPPPGRLSY